MLFECCNLAARRSCDQSRQRDVEWDGGSAGVSVERAVLYLEPNAIPIKLRPSNQRQRNTNGEWVGYFGPGCLFQANAEMRPTRTQIDADLRCAPIEGAGRAVVASHQPRSTYRDQPSATQEREFTWHRSPDWKVRHLPQNRERDWDQARSVQATVLWLPAAICGQSSSPNYRRNRSTLPRSARTWLLLRTQY